MNYKLGSFNMYKFQAYRSDDKIKKNMDMIAKIIYDEGFHIVALQEVFDSKPMEMILRRLGSKWTGYWARPNSRSVMAAEGYAFIWNTKYIELAKSLTVSGEREYEPRIYKQYRIDRKAGQTELVRDPLYGRFKPKGENFEIRIINTHIMYSQENSHEEESKVNQVFYQGDILMRRKELDVLIRNILAKENVRRYGNNLPAYTILMGDYNLNLNRDWTNGAYLQEVVEIEDANKTYRYVTVQDQLTTLKGRTRSEPNEPARGFANNYDHFTYEKERMAQLHPKVGRVDSVKKYYQEDFEKHKKEISDHVPISLEISTKG